MALLASTIPGEVGLRLLLSPFSSNVVLRTACCTVGIALPVYSTFKAIEKKDQSEQEKWLLYWAAYGSFSLVEVFTDKLVSWIPFYYHLKFAFLVWLQFPSGNGARHLYARYLRPFLLKHQDGVDRLLSFSSKEIVRLVKSHEGEIQFVKALGKRFALTGSQVVKEVVIQPGQADRQSNAIEGRHSSADGVTSSSES